MSKIISTNKLNRLWVNGIKPTVDKVKNTIKDRSGLMSNSEENKLVDALAIKEAIEHHDMFMDNITCGSLDEFLQKTAVKINLANHSIPAIGRVKDTTGWGPNKVSGLWYRFIVLYQNGYSTSINDNINGNGIFWTDNDMWNVTILGIQSTGFTLKYERVNKPTITTKSDLMANTVSGLFPDALAVKDAVNYINVAKNRNTSYATLEELLEGFASDVSIPSITYIKDTGGWGPLNNQNQWYKIIAVVQDTYVDGHAYPTSLSGFIMSAGGSFWIIHVKGKKGEAATVTYKTLTTSHLLDDTLKTTTCSLIGSVTPGEFTYNTNRVQYYVTGNVLHLGINMSIKSIVTNPEGELRILIDLPDVLTIKSFEDALYNVNTSYTKGGYKQCFRRVATANAYKSGGTGIFLTLRQYQINSSGNVNPILSNATYTANVGDVGDDKPGFCLIDEKRAVIDNVLYLSGFILLKDK